MAVLEISILPVGTDTASISSFVQEAVEEIEKKGLHYTVTPTANVYQT